MHHSLEEHCIKEKELEYEVTTHLEDTHDLGILTKVSCHFCGECVAGQGKCCHMA